MRWGLCVALLVFAVSGSAGCKRSHGSTHTVPDGGSDASVATDGSTADASVATDGSTSATVTECVTFCERNNACDPGTTPAECDADCPALVTVVANGGCQSLWDAVVTCSTPLDMESFCSLSSGSCSGPYNSWLTCVTGYCDAHMSAPECARF